MYNDNVAIEKKLSRKTKVKIKINSRFKKKLEFTFNLKSLKTNT